MSKLRIKSAHLRKFGSVIESTVEFPESGFVLVTGRNNTGSGRLESVGSGKTLLGEAISRALFNVPGRFKRFSGYSTHGAGDTYVKITAELQGQKLVVEIGYKCKELSPSGEGLRFTLGDQTPVMFGDMSDTRRELDRIVGMTASVAEWTVYIDGSKLNFNSLSESASVNLLMGALNQPPWTDYQRKAARVAEKFKESLIESDGKHIATKQSVYQSKISLDSATAALAEANQMLLSAKEAYQLRIQEAKIREAELRHEIEAATNEMLSIKKKIAAATISEAEKYHEAELEYQRLNSTWAESQRARAKLEREYGELATAYEKLKGEKQKAVTEHNQKSYAEANQLRRQVMEEVRRIESQNAKAQNLWNTQERTLANAIGPAQLAYEKCKSTFESCVEKHERAINVPSVCPLAGCGKQWPRTNSAEVDAAVAAAEKSKQLLEEREKDLQRATQAHQEISAQKPVLLPVPLVPEEKPIPEFPDDSLWDAKILKHYETAMAVHKKVEECDSLLSDMEKVVQAAKEKVNSLREAGEVQNLSSQYQALENSKSANDSALAGLLAKLEEGKPDSSTVDQATIIVNERQTVLEKYKATLEQTAQDLSECLEAKKAADYWVQAFGATGIPNLIINESVHPLNAVSKKISLRMTGGLLEVTYDTKRQLKTQDREKNELTILINNRHGSVQIGGSSKGESGLLDLIIAETIAEVGNVTGRIGYRFYDEVTQSQDQTVRRSIFAYLKELAQSTGILVFVVDHSVEVSSYVSHVLVAEKTAAGTTYKWQ